MEKIKETKNWSIRGDNKGQYPSTVSEALALDQRAKDLKSGESLRVTNHGFNFIINRK